MAVFKVYPWFILVYIFCLKTHPLSCQYLANVKNNTQDVSSLKDAIDELTSYLTNCIKMQCKFVCFNGKANELPKHIAQAANHSTLLCPIIEELRIYNYEFPNNILARGFLGEYANRVESLYIASSAVRDYESGVFGNGTFQKLHFENLEFKDMRQDFFEDISSDFQELTIIQKETPLKSVCDSFLNYVKYQIKYLSLQLGISCLYNVTATYNLLNNLAYVDFSYNNFGNDLKKDSFEKLSMVQHLDLSYCKISVLPEYIFSDMTYTLTYLDLSHNHLLTIYRTIFGWEDISRDMKIFAHNNDWECSCDLQFQMESIFAFQYSKMFCNSPEKYLNWSVFDTRICTSEVGPPIDGQYPTTSPPPTPIPGFNSSTAIAGITTETIAEKPQFTRPENLTTTPPEAIDATTAKQECENASTASPGDSNIVHLECHTAKNTLQKSRQHIKLPSTHFDIFTKPNQTVHVATHSDSLADPHGLIWFNKVTTKYNKMEVNYNEYGLGCWGNISPTTTVQNLMPNFAYTFCMVLRNQLTVSPFNCKSIHVSSNMKVSHSAWLTEDMRATGISLVIFGIVIFTLIGILITFVLLKRKPTLLKGSRRVARSKSNLGQIIVFPKDKTWEDFTKRVESLSKRNSSSIIAKPNRRCSVDTASSYQSYINVNMYEVIPDYLKFDVDFLTATDTQNFDSNPPESATSRTDVSISNSASYAELPYSVKRVSSDPLPDLPHDQEPLSLALSEHSVQSGSRRNVEFNTANLYV